jgi:hypothetical protein
MRSARLDRDGRNSSGLREGSRGERFSAGDGGVERERTGAADENDHE